MDLSDQEVLNILGRDIFVELGKHCHELTKEDILTRIHTEVMWVEGIESSLASRHKKYPDATRVQMEGMVKRSYAEIQFMKRFIQLYKE